MNRSVCRPAMDQDSEATTKVVGSLDSEMDYAMQVQVESCSNSEVRYLGLDETDRAKAYRHSPVVDGNDLVERVGGKCNSA